MKWLDTNVGSIDTALQQTPEVFQSVGVDCAINVGHRVINNLVGVLSGQTFVRKQFIGVERGASFDALFDFLLHDLLAAVFDYNGLDSSAPLDEADNGSFVLASGSSDAALPLGNVHI